MLSTGGKFTRGFKPRWSTELYNVARVEGAFVWDDQGNRYLSKFTQPVRGNVDDPPARRIEMGGSEQNETRKRQVLIDFAERVKRQIGDGTVTLSQVGTFLRRVGGFQAAAREARLNMKTPVANFLRAFPDTFDLRIDGTGRSFVRVLRGPLAFEGATRLRRAVG